MPDHTNTNTKLRRFLPWIVVTALLVALGGLLYARGLDGTGPAATQTAVLPDTGPELEADGPQVALFGVFETQVVNTKSYSNPYDYRVIELQARFTSPSGKQYSFFGFHDGDGNGGPNGNVWRLRFMPNEAGRWSYSYGWSDGSPGGSGNFDVADTGLPGPLQVAKDNSWYFQTARGAAFNWRGYSLHRYLHWKYGRGVYTDGAWSDLQNQIVNRVAGRGYNAVMLRWPTITRSGEDYNGDNNGHHFWQQKGKDLDFSRFHPQQWRKIEQTLNVASGKGVYVFQFVAMVDQSTPRPKGDQMKPFLRYMAARLGPFWNNFGYSFTWEYQDLVGNDEADGYLRQLNDNLKGLPVRPLLSIHDHSNNRFKGWLSFSMRQQGSRSVFDGNCRSCGQHGGVGGEFTNLPIVGSEDIWEDEGGGVNMPRNAAEVRRGAWGGLLAGAMPVYLEVSDSNGSFKGTGEGEVRRMWDFYYSKTKYRQYKQLNNLVEKGKGQVASGIPGQEYLVYDQDGGTITINLSGMPSSTVFSVLWFDPTNGNQKSGGTVNGGGSQKLTSPFGQDSVLLLSGGSHVVSYKNKVFLPFTARK